MIGLFGLTCLYVIPSTHTWLQNLTILSGDPASELSFLASLNGETSASPVVNQRSQTVGADTASVVDPSSSNQTPVAVPTFGSSDSQFAVLLMGYGGGGHDGEYLTDSMMVVIVDPTRKTLTMLSLPRDSWVPLTFNAKTTVYNKINTAYAFAQDPTEFPDRLARYDGDQGPGNFATDTVSRLLGIPIRYYVALDFEGFREMIDTVGGIDVDVPDSFSAHYPVNDDPSINAAWKTIHFQQGVEHMNGERAIEFARARETIDNLAEGTDFARSRRQRLIIEAFKARLLAPGGLIHLPQLVAIGTKHVDTNYEIPGAGPLAQLILGWRSVAFYQTALTTDNFLEDGTGPDGTYIVVPSTSDHSWSQIRAFARKLWKDPSLGVTLADTPVAVENDTGTAGEATRVSEGLLKLGYQVADPIAGTRQTQTRLIDRTGGKAAPLIHQLQADLHLANIDVVSEDPTDSPEVVLALGEDNADLSVSVPTDSSTAISQIGVVHFGDSAAGGVPTPTEALRVAMALQAVPTSTETEPAQAKPLESAVRPTSSPTVELKATPLPHPTASHAPERGVTPTHSPLPRATATPK